MVFYFCFVIFLSSSSLLMLIFDEVFDVDLLNIIVLYINIHGDCLAYVQFGHLMPRAIVRIWWIICLYRVSAHGRRYWWHGLVMVCRSTTMRWSLWRGLAQSICIHIVFIVLALITVGVDVRSRILLIEVSWLIKWRQVAWFLNLLHWSYRLHTFGLLLDARAGTCVTLHLPIIWFTEDVVLPRRVIRQLLYMTVVACLACVQVWNSQFDRWDAVLFSTIDNKALHGATLDAAVTSSTFVMMFDELWNLSVVEISQSSHPVCILSDRADVTSFAIDIAASG